jgi:CspA family cold shock protein
MYKGEVKWYNPEKGFGFISLDQGGDVFVHHTDIEGAGYRTLWEGQKVSLETEVRPGNDKRVKARHVKITDDGAWKDRYPKCYVCNGSGERKDSTEMCHPCQGRGVLDMKGLYVLATAHAAAAERRYQREQEWKRQAKRSKGIWGWIKKDTCSAACRRWRKKISRNNKKAGETIKYYRRLLDENDIDYRHYHTEKRGSIKGI